MGEDAGVEQEKKREQELFVMSKGTVLFDTFSVCVSGMIQFSREDEMH